MHSVCTLCSEQRIIWISVSVPLLFNTAHKASVLYSLGIAAQKHFVMCSGTKTTLGETEKKRTRDTHDWEQKRDEDNRGIWRWGKEIESEDCSKRCGLLPSWRVQIEAETLIQWETHFTAITPSTCGSQGIGWLFLCERGGGERKRNREKHWA